MLFEPNFCLNGYEKPDFDQISRDFDEKMSSSSHWFPHYSQEYRKFINYDDAIKDVKFMQSNLSKIQLIKKPTIPSKQTHQGYKPEKSEGRKQETSSSYTSKISSKISKMSRDRLGKSNLSASCVSLTDQDNDELAISGIFFRKLLWIENQYNDIRLPEEYSLDDYSILFEIIWLNRPFIDLSLFEIFDRNKLLELCKNTSFQTEEFSNKYNFHSIMYFFLLMDALQSLKAFMEDIKISVVDKQIVQICRNLIYSVKKFFENMKQLSAKKGLEIDFNRKFPHFQNYIEDIKQNVNCYDQSLQQKSEKIWSRVKYNGKLIKDEIISYFDNLVKDLLLVNNPEFFSKLLFILESPTNMRKINWGRVNAMRQYLANNINEKKNFSLDCFHATNVLSKNIVLANLKFSFLDHSPILLPLYDPNYPIYSIHDLNVCTSLYLKKDQSLALLKYAYAETSKLEEIEYNYNELNHSEKALVGYILQNFKGIITDLVNSLKAQNYNLSPFNSILLQIWSFRDSCVQCESLLSDNHWELYSGLLQEFLQFTHQDYSWLYDCPKDNLCINKELSFSMYLPDSSFLAPEDKIRRHMNSKYLEKDYIAKDFFSFEFLRRYLTRSDIIYPKRTFFVSGIKVEGNFQPNLDNYLKNFKDNELKVANMLNTRITRLIRRF